MTDNNILMKFILSKILLISLIISGIVINKDIFVFKNHEYAKNLTVYLKKDNEDYLPLTISQGTLFKDLLNDINYDTNAKYLYGLNEPLYDEEYLDLTVINTDRISINSGTYDELNSLPGIGPKTADGIIEYRQTYGAFNYLEELKNVSGIGDKKFEKLKEFICL